MIIYLMLHIQNSLGIKFQTKLTILNFLTKLTQKRVFLIKKRNPHRFLHI